MGNVSYKIGGTDNVVSFLNAAPAPIDSLKLHFKPTQESKDAVSPTNSVPAVGWGKCNVYKSGKNLVNISDENIMNRSRYISQGATYTINDNGITVVVPDKVVGYVELRLFVMKIDSSMVDKRCYFQYIKSISASKCRLYTSDPNLQNQKEIYLFPHTFSSEEVGKILYIVFQPAYHGTYEFTNVQLEIGNKQTRYAPFIGETIEVELPIIGKNLIDMNKAYPNGDTSITFGGKNGKTDGSLILKPGTYTVSSNAPARSLTVARKDGLAIFNKFDVNSATFTLSIETEIRIIYYVENVTQEQLLSYNYQLELGSTATEYEPCKRVLGGYVDVVTGDVVEEWHHETKHITGDMGTPGGTGTYSEDYRYIAFNLPSKYLVDNNKREQALCNLAPYNQQNTEPIRFWVASGTAYLYLPADGKEYDVDIWYPCQTHETYHIEPMPIKTCLGQNYIWSDTNDVTEVSYAIHDSAMIQTAKKRIAAFNSVKMQEYLKQQNNG